MIGCFEVQACELDEYEIIHSTRIFVTLVSAFSTMKTTNILPHENYLLYGNLLYYWAFVTNNWCNDNFLVWDTNIADKHPIMIPHLKINFLLYSK